MMNDLDLIFRTYVEGSGKSPSKGQTLKGKKKVCEYEKVLNMGSFGGLLRQGMIDISFDSDDLSQSFWDMAEENNWSCLIMENPSNGHIHSFWKIPETWRFKDGKDKKLACGLVADVHSKDTYIPIKVDGVERQILYCPDDIQVLPEELWIVNTQINLLGQEKGDGRNEDLFKYILILQGQLGLDKEVIRRILTNTNRFVFTDPLPQQELDIILRDEAFEAPASAHAPNVVTPCGTVMLFLYLRPSSARSPIVVGSVNSYFTTWVPVSLN